MKPVPDLRSLAPLIGKWATVLRWSQETHRLVGGPAELSGSATFRWIEGGKFLHYQFASSHWMIGRDESSAEYCVLYGDDREVSRVYRMTVARGVWKMWRDTPGFHQRFEGRLRRGGRRIDAVWERSSDGRKWVHDFDLTFSRRAAPVR